jgi:hypothetical protein
MQLQDCLLLLEFDNMISHPAGHFFSIAVSFVALSL